MKMYQKVLIAFLLVLFLGGAKCSPDDPASSRIELDPSLLVRCPELPYVDLDRVSLGDLTLEYSKLQGQYIECAIRNDCLIEAVGDKTVVTCPVLDTLKKAREETDG
jgi:hypothetical protein